MSDLVSLPVILGTNRSGRQSEKVANYIYQTATKHDSIQSELVDVRDFDFPANNYGQELKDDFVKYKELVERADGLILVVPEYNHGYPGVLKSVLDLLLPEYKHKAVGLVGVSAGPWGGTRVIESMLPVVRELGLIVSAVDLNFPRVQEVFDESGSLEKPEFEERASLFLDEMIWLSQTLKRGRENI